MMQNFRQIPLVAHSCQMEKWFLAGNEYKVQVTHGKPIDILTVKKNTIEDFAHSVHKKKESVKLWLNTENLEKVELCPLCKTGTDSASEVVKIHGQPYYQCTKCSHCFLLRRLSKNKLEEYFKHDEYYRATYTDNKIIQARVNQVSVPKLEWVLKEFGRIYHRRPEAILDVGAGAGHFVYACRKRGISADGIEISQQGIEFCRNNFGIELMNKDFLSDSGEFNDSDYDVVTFWGVLECVPYPQEMIKAAYRVLSKKKGMVIVEVPRWNSFSTAIQKTFPDSVVRHLDPIGHIQIFTDFSLSGCFRKNGFDIVAAWYFGMDIYELVSQTSFALQNNETREILKRVINSLQEQLDAGKLSDEMIFAGVAKSQANETF